MGQLDGKVAVVTGGGRGVGHGIALELAEAGADVEVASRNMANLEEVVGEIKTMGRRSLAVATDIGVKQQVRLLEDRLQQLE